MDVAAQAVGHKWKFGVVSLRFSNCGTGGVGASLWCTWYGFGFLQGIYWLHSLWTLFLSMYLYNCGLVIWAELEPLYTRWFLFLRVILHFPFELVLRDGGKLTELLLVTFSACIFQCRQYLKHVYQGPTSGVSDLTFIANHMTFCKEMFLLWKATTWHLLKICFQLW